MQNGIVYITFVKNKKAESLKELRHSVESVKKVHPQLPVTLFTDADPRISSIDNVQIVDVIGERIKQIYLYDSSYENTLYMDCDTRVVGSIIELFDLMPRFDIAASIDHMRKFKDTAKTWDRYDAVPDGFSEFAGGIILFRKAPVVSKFFDLWKTRYKEWCKVSGRFNDQPSFRVSMYESPDLKVHTLPPEYNLRSKKYHNITPRIYHNHSLWKNNKADVGGNIWI